MRLIHPARIIAVLLVLMAGLVLSAQAGELQVDTTTRSGPLRLTVRFKDGKEAWAQSILDESPPYIRKVERYLKSPLRWNRYLIIEGCDNCTSRAELQQHTIYLDYRYSSPEDVSVLFHEIDHLWFYYYVNRSSEEWLIEGISSFLPTAMREARMLEDKALYHETIDRYWGRDVPLGESIADTPLYPFNEGKRSLVYLKSYRIQYLLHCMLGQKKYLSFVKRVAVLTRRSPSRIVALLNGYKTANWKRVLTGWVLRGGYRGISMNDFILDADSDGLSRAREYCERTNSARYDSDGDSLPDGAELLLGRNPRRADADGAALLAQYGPFTDGSDADWAPFSPLRATDPADDSTGPAWSDMRELMLLVKDEMLHVVVKTAAAPPESSTVFFDMLVDTDGDNQTNEEFAFFLRTPMYPWQYSYATEQATQLDGLKGARGAVLEMAIPLAALGAGPFRVLPIIRDDTAKANYDEWGEWVVVPLRG